MKKLASRSVIYPSPAANLCCPKCDATMNLARLVRLPSGFDIRTFECTRCNHAHIVTASSELSGETRSPADMAADALEEAREMAPGTQRSEALKRAGLLRRATDQQVLVSPKRRRL